MVGAVRYQFHLCPPKEGRKSGQGLAAISCLLYLKPRVFSLFSVETIVKQGKLMHDDDQSKSPSKRSVLGELRMKSRTRMATQLEREAMTLEEDTRTQGPSLSLDLTANTASPDGMLSVIWFSTWKRKRAYRLLLSYIVPSTVSYTRESERWVSFRFSAASLQRMTSRRGAPAPRPDYARKRLRHRLQRDPIRSRATAVQVFRSLLFLLCSARRSSSSSIILLCKAALPSTMLTAFCVTNRAGFLSRELTSWRREDSDLSLDRRTWSSTRRRWLWRLGGAMETQTSRRWRSRLLPRPLIPTAMATRSGKRCVCVCMYIYI